MRGRLTSKPKVQFKSAPRGLSELRRAGCRQPPCRYHVPIHLYRSRPMRRSLLACFLAALTFLSAPISAAAQDAAKSVSSGKVYVTFRVFGGGAVFAIGLETGPINFC